MTGITLVTGGSGFVGRQILKALSARPVRLRLITRDPAKLYFTSDWENIERIVVTSDLFAESTAWWQSVCSGVDTLIHSAWYAEPGHYLHSPRNLDCLIGTLQMAKGAAEAHVHRFVGLGTCLEYASGDQPKAFNSPLSPQSPYASAKAATYLALAQTLPLLGVEFAWCRLFHLYGENEDARRLTPYLRNKLAAGETAELSSGTQTLDFLDVTRAGEMIVNTAFSNTQGATNICSGNPMTVREIAEQIADEYGRRDLLSFGSQSKNPASEYLVGLPGQAYPTSPLRTGKEQSES